MAADPIAHASSARAHEHWIDAARVEFEHHARRVEDAPTVASGPGSPLEENPLREALPGYRISGEIARGGQAVVYRATQLGTQRDVAIKVIRLPTSPGSGVLARFEREVQILGQLKHPNIVTILDSGQTRGLLYYIMDYVEGWALDDYLARNKLDIHARVALFAKVCAAVNLAHLRGITHRDLKPSNIRVDASGEPRVLDFGLAKIAELDGSSAAYTRTGDFVGSLPWASPEQVEGKPENLDIRTDVYSLGVMLYQTLTGRRPYDVTGPLREAAERICRTEPSTVKSLNRAIDDDLSTIVARCLRKRPEERYQSAGDLQRELERYLRGEAIEAKRDSTLYMLRKAIHRHRGRAAVAALLLATGVYSVALLTYLYNNEARLRNDAENARQDAVAQAAAAKTAQAEAEKQSRISDAVNDFMQDDLLAAARPDQLGKEVTVVEVLDRASESLKDRFANQPEVEVPLRLTLGKSYFKLGKPDKALEHYDAGYAIVLRDLGPNHSDAMQFRSNMAAVYEQTGRVVEAAELSRTSLEFCERAFGPDHEHTILQRSNLAWALFRANQPAEAEEQGRRAHEDGQRVLGPDHERSLDAASKLGAILRERGKLDEAEPLHQQVLEGTRRLHGEKHPSTALAMGNLAALYRARGRSDEAIALYVDVLERRRETLGEAHPSTLLTQTSLATMYGSLRRNEEAIALLEDGLRVGRPALGEQHTSIMSMRSNLATLYDRMQRSAEAEPLHRAALAAGEASLPPDHPYLGLYRGRLGFCLVQMGCADEAEPLLLDGYRISVATDGPRSSSTRSTAGALVQLYTERGEPEHVIELWQHRADGEQP